MAGLDPAIQARTKAVRHRLDRRLRLLDAGGRVSGKDEPGTL
jgi:hypothetical protein